MAKGNFIEYVVSDNPNKYPNDGEQSGYYYETVVNVETEEQTVTAGTTPIEVVPSAGKLISKVSINPTPTEEKTITAGTSATTVTPTSGKYIKKVTVNPTPSQSKTVTPSTSQQTVSPDSGKLLSQVIVKAMEDVTPEVTAQTPVITQIAENLGVIITTPSGTNKQILQGNNANLQLISGYKPASPTGIEITTPPAKTTYNAGENIDLTGIVVTATFSDGSTQDVTSECTFSPVSGTVIYEDTAKITANWTWKGTRTYSAIQSITVKRVLTGLSITTQPAKTSYYKGDALDLTGTVVTATFNSGASEDVTSGCSFSPASGAVLTTTGSKPVTVSYTENGVTKTATFSISVTDPIYGVEWDGTSSTKFSRTDAAELFTDPVPYVSGASSYGSPFDNIFPWSDMQIVDDATAGKLVKIPKYYYKWTKSGAKMKLQISEAAFDGSHVSPAHADRGDGKGERDVVYVGRYHCNSSYKSVSGQTSVTSITRATARTNIHNLGSSYWQYDFAMYWTICMLYLVEFADWNSQAKIGYGCSPSDSEWNVGYTDSMPYHTGTTASARTSYGGTQYRHIEGLWDNVYDWCDGIYFSGANVYCIKNPSSFSDSSGGTLVGTRPTSSGYISAFNVPTANGFEYALYTSAISGSKSTYITDYCLPGGGVLHVGGYYSQTQICGLFCLLGNDSASDKYNYIGCRLQKLP